MLSMRCNPEDEKLIKKFAASRNQKVSEFLRQAALEKIEDEIDLKMIREYEEKSKKGELKYCSHEEAKKLLGL